MTLSEITAAQFWSGRCREWQIMFRLRPQRIRRALGDIRCNCSCDLCTYGGFTGRTRSCPVQHGYDPLGRRDTVVFHSLGGGRNRRIFSAIYNTSTPERSGASQHQSQALVTANSCLRTLSLRSSNSLVFDLGSERIKRLHLVKKLNTYPDTHR